MLESQRRQSMDHCLLDVLERERSLVTKLLYTMVPPKIARDLSNGLPVAPELFKYCVVFFSDIEGFTAFGDTHSPFEVFDMLNNLFSVMDYVVTCFPALYKVETVGECTRFV
jgi:atrial natriuretic peptide receptor A